MMDQIMAVEYGMNRTGCRNLDGVWQLEQRAAADFLCTPIWLVALGGYDGRFDLLRQLVGVAERPPRAIGEALKAALLVSLEDFVTRLAGDAKLAAQGSHAFAV